MDANEAASLVGKPVKVRRQRGVPGYHHGRLDAVTKDDALVTLTGHGHAEWVPVGCIRRWRKGEHMAEARSVR